jgi:hypothetical protein
MRRIADLCETVWASSDGCKNSDQRMTVELNKISAPLLFFFVQTYCYSAGKTLQMLAVILLIVLVVYATAKCDNACSGEF